LTRANGGPQNPKRPKSLQPKTPQRVLNASLKGTTIEFFDFYINGTADVLE
jgi:hypothetical protein